MKKICLLFAFICATTSIFAQSGKSCGDAIPVDSNYVGTVEGAGTMWYTAGTYDLPLNVFFMPASDTSTVSPTIMVDFTCTPGVYDDPKVDNLLTMVEDFGYDFPITLTCDKVIRDGKYAWELSIKDEYRTQMAAFGITYNVQAFIKVDFVEGGSVTMSPDTAFQSCMENAEYLQLDDTLLIWANDPDRSFVLPYTDWQNDSVRFVWIGEGETEIYVAQGKCDFEPNTMDSYVWDMYTLKDGQPHKLYSHQMKDAISQWSNGGLFYGKIVATKPGKLVVEKIPMGEIQGGATLLEYGKPIQLPANNADALYCFPKTWGATQWLTNTSDTVQMYISTTSDFDAVVGGANVLNVNNFDLVDGKSALYWSSVEMKMYTDLATSDYLYVRFLSKKATTLTNNQWSPSECVDNSILLRPNVEQIIPKKSGSTIYRFRYDGFAGYPLVISSSVSGTMRVYVGEGCGFELTSNDVNVIFNSNISRKGSTNISSEIIASWASRVDDDGFLYFKAYHERSGGVTFITEKPAPTPEPDPEPEPEPEPIRPIALQLNTPINVLADNVAQAYYFTQDWANQSVEFEANTADSIVAYFGTTPDFDIFNADADYVAAYPFFIEDNQSRLQLSTKQLSTLLTENASDTIFVLFYSYNATQVTPILWNACACVENSLELMSTDQKMLLANNYNTVYRIKYNQWQNYDVRLLWNSDVTLSAYLGYTCDFKLTVKNKYVLNKSQVDISPNDSMIIGEEVRTKAIDEGKLPDDGFLYFKFYSTDSGILTTSHPDKGNTPGVGTGVDGTVVGDALRRVICTPDGHIYILVDGNRYTLLGEQL